MPGNNPFEYVTEAINNITRDFAKAFGYEPNFRRTIPAQDVVIEDVTEDETKEDENDGRNLCNRSLPDVR